MTAVPHIPRVLYFYIIRNALCLFDFISQVLFSFKVLNAIIINQKSTLKNTYPLSLYRMYSAEHSRSKTTPRWGSGQKIHLNYLECYQIPLQSFIGVSVA